jgi:hypothetical protein
MDLSTVGAEDYQFAPKRGQRGVADVSRCGCVDDPPDCERSKNKITRGEALNSPLNINR